MDCYTCEDLQGIRRINPGVTLFDGKFWKVEHVYPCAMTGWLVIMLKRHAEAFHELSTEEFNEYSNVLEIATKALHRIVPEASKEYVVFFAETEHFKHLHVHVVARSKDLPAELQGGKIFQMIKVSEADAVPKAHIEQFCVTIRNAINNGK